MRTLPLLAAFLLGCAAQAAADDWPQWRGPHRDGVSKETGLLQEWPAGGPKLLWKITDLGGGYSTPSIADGRIFLMSDRDGEESVLVLDVKDGKRVWATPVGKVGPNRGPQYPGARSTPTVDGALLYALASGGELVCLETATGKERWHKNLQTDFGGKPGNWAYAESPLVDGDVVVCTPGGSTATFVALDKKTGDVIWKSAVPGGDEAAYASIVLGEVGGVKEYVQFLQHGVVGVDAKTGKFLWRYDNTGKSPANIPTPVFHDAHVFSSSGFTGAGLVKLNAENERVMPSQVYLAKELGNSVGGVVLVNGFVYGTSNTDLVCLEFASGKVRWQDRSVGKGSVCYADNRLYVRGEKGTVALAEATPDGYHEKGRLEQPGRSDKPAWPYPVVANGRLYLRDRDVLLCYDVRAGAADK
jgi:outer membrane protein assembly factor BamB